MRDDQKHRALLIALAEELKAASRADLAEAHGLKPSSRRGLMLTGSGIRLAEWAEEVRKRSEAQVQNGDSLQDFLSQLTELSLRHGIGITDDPTTFVMTPEDYDRAYTTGPDSRLHFE